VCLPDKGLSAYGGETTRTFCDWTKLDDLRACLVSDGEPTPTKTRGIVREDNQERSKSPLLLLANSPTDALTGQM